jgi:Flp pilus assembly protein TadG
MRLRLEEERGAAAVEFAIILTVLVVILMAILEFGREFSRLQVFQGAAREGGRAAAVGEDPATVGSKVNDAAAPYTLSEAPLVAVSGGGTQCTADTRGQSVTVSWDQQFQLDIPFWDAVTMNRQISAVFRCE